MTQSHSFPTPSDLSSMPLRARQAATPCFVCADPDAEARLDAALSKARGGKGLAASALGLVREPRVLGLNDGTILPPSDFPLGTPAQVIRSAAADRAPLRGTVRIVVVLADFSDKAMTTTAAHIRDLFFSTGVIPTGSVKEYYSEVTGGLVTIAGEVVGPYRLPHTLAWYANGDSGMGAPGTGAGARAPIMAADALAKADADVNFAPYDNDGNGYVDAYLVVHAGQGAEQTLSGGDIWSHKWAMPSVVNTDGTKVWGYLTIPEDAKIGVCAHELGHLLFGFPDLYDTDKTSSGVGNWCLMGAGSWNGGGDTPAHPGAWCKVNQGWATVNNIGVNGLYTVNDVKTSRQVFRLWKDGGSGQEYFLLENRQRTGFDKALPGDGLVLWHIDDAQPGNTDENHYKVGVVQADGLRQLEQKVNRGDGGDPFPGSAGVTSVSTTTNPHTKSYAGADTKVSVSGIPASSPAMTVNITVRTAFIKIKDTKDALKELRDSKNVRKELAKEFKEYAKELRKDFKDNKEFKEFKEIEIPGGWRPGLPGGGGLPGGLGDAGVNDPYLGYGGAYGDAAYGGAYAGAGYGAYAGGGAYGGYPAQAFIGPDLRPDLVGGPAYGGAEAQQDVEKRMSEGDVSAKRAFDTPPMG